MRGTSILLLTLLLGCGKATISGDAGPGGDDANNNDAMVGTECLPDETECSGDCFDTSSDHDHCGDCTTVCGDDQVCDQSECSASCSNPDHTVCEGACVDTASDHRFCGSCTNACTDSQTCQAGICEDLQDLAQAQIASIWADVTGWINPDQQPISATFETVPVPDARYRCRTGHENTIAAMTFTACDGGDGTQPRHSPTPVTGMEEGHYRTEMLIQVGPWLSAPVVYEFYVHHSLDGVADCVPPQTPDQAFAAALALATPASYAAAPPFDVSTAVRPPFIHLPFKNVIKHQNMNDGWQSLSTGDPLDVDLISLRRRFVLSADRKLLVIQRDYESRMHRNNRGVGTCRNSYRFGVNHYVSNGSPARHYPDCGSLVLNSRGEAVCLDPAGAFYTDIGWAKLTPRREAFSNKGMTENCVGSIDFDCWAWYLHIPD